MVVTNIVLNDLGANINTMLVTTKGMNVTVQLKMCHKITHAAMCSMSCDPLLMCT